MDDERQALIEAVREIQHQATRQAAAQMSNEQLMAVIITELGLPAGTQLTDEQLEMVILAELGLPAGTQLTDDLLSLPFRAERSKTHLSRT